MPKAKPLKEEKLEIKKDPVAIRLPQDIIQLGRSIARSNFGGEDKLGLMIEEAIKFYSANQENEVRASALLEITEERLVRRISDQFNSMQQELMKREKQMVNRIAGLQAISAFETSLTESMLKDRLVKSDKEQVWYEELRSVASRKMKDRLDKAGAEQIAELQDQVLSQEQTIQELSAELEKARSEWKKTYQKAMNEEKLRKSREESLHEEQREVQRLKKVIEKQNKLLHWYERRDKEIPELQVKNASLGGLKKQSYEEARAEFEQCNLKPKL